MYREQGLASLDNTVRNKGCEILFYWSVDRAVVFSRYIKYRTILI